MPLSTTQLKNENHYIFLILASPSITSLSIYSTPGFLGNHYLELWVVISFIFLPSFKKLENESHSVMSDPL